MKKIIILSIFILSAPVFAGDPHHNPETVVNNYSINKFINTYGLAAVHAANQIHPSENVSGLQLGGGLAQDKDSGNFGGAIGAAFNFKGLGLVNGSYAKAGKIELWGVGLNFNFKKT